MLTLLSWLSFVALLPPPTGVTQPRPVPEYVAADSEATILLTPDVVTPYTKLVKTLKVYWAEHPEEAQAALAHHAHSRNVIQTRGTKASLDVLDYVSLTQQDTALAAIFVKQHFAPAQFEPMQVAVYRAIAALLLHQTPDSTTTQGKNMALVQTHRTDFSDDWGELAGVINQLPPFLRGG